LVSGALIGLVLAAGNVYTSFKVSFIDGGSITAALLAFGLFAAFRRSGGHAYGPLENNITQTTASSAAVMSFVTGVVGPIPALELGGVRVSYPAVILFGVAVGVLGIFVAALLRRRLIVDEPLPFPTGIATGEVIETLFRARQVAVRRLWLLLIGALIAGAVTWLRDGRPAIVPQALMLGGTLGGIGAATLGLGVAVSPLMLATGAMVGLRGALGMLAGAVAARVVIAPWLARTAIVASAQPGTLNAWLVWPSLGLMLAGSFLPLLLDAGTIVRSWRQLASVARALTAAPRSGGAPSLRVWAPLLIGCVVILVVVGRVGLGVEPLAMAIALVLGLFLANVAARSAGETDFCPAGPVGTVTQIAIASRGAAGGLIAGSLAMGVSTQTTQMLWAFRAGHRVGGSPRAQVGAQLLGVAVGALVTVPVYFVISSSYGIGNETMPAVAALSWKATADAMHGLATLPRFGAAAAVLALAGGALLILLGRLPFGRFLPSAASVGVGVMLPFSLTVAAVAGALLALAAQALSRRRGFDEASIVALAAGAIAGESTIGVGIATLIATGVF
jgi:uncharacterized oligopeptide transporter (OPT) family protein